MSLPEKRIIDFIREHHVLTLATALNNSPWCANCFYAYMEAENCFVFTSDDDTQHARDALSNPKVAGSIVLETKVVGKIQGIQFQGSMERPDDNIHKKAKKVYLKKFPYAALMKTSLWVLYPEHIKMTDNRLGFGKKIIWQKQ